MPSDLTPHHLHEDDLEGQDLRTYFVGEAPARSMDGKAVPAFSSEAGRRVSEWIGERVQDAFQCRNLLHDWPGSAGKGSKFPLDEAKVGAGSLKNEMQEVRRINSFHQPRIILVGLRVARAWNLPARAYSYQNYLQWHDEPTNSWAVLPHPSGVNRWYNEVQNVRDAVAFLLTEIERSRKVGTLAQRQD